MGFFVNLKPENIGMLSVADRRGRRSLQGVSAIQPSCQAPNMIFLKGDCADMQNWTYCVVGNIKESHVDENGILRNGTAAFAGGAKVYLCGRLWDRSRDEISTLGITRGKKLQVVQTDISLIENVRCQKVFRTGVLEMMDNFEFRSCWWGKSKHEKADAEEFVAWWNNRPESTDEPASLDPEQGTSSGKDTL